MKIKYEGTVYDVIDGYSQGYIIKKLERGYQFVGKPKSDCEVIDNSPIEYVKSRKFLPQIRYSYSKTIFIDKEHISGEFEIEENTITVYNNVVIFYSPSKHMATILDIAKSSHAENNYVWGFERHEDDTISLSPSIKSTQHEFQEHYFIKRNKVVNWCNDSWETVYIKKEINNNE